MTNEKKMTSLMESFLNSSNNKDLSKAKREVTQFLLGLKDEIILEEYLIFKNEFDIYTNNRIRGLEIPLLNFDPIDLIKIVKRYDNRKRT